MIEIEEIQKIKMFSLTQLNYLVIPNWMIILLVVIEFSKISINLHFCIVVSSKYDRLQTYNLVEYFSRY